VAVTAVPLADASDVATIWCRPGSIAFTCPERLTASARRAPTIRIEGSGITLPLASYAVTLIETVSPAFNESESGSMVMRATGVDDAC
jgi:hypothetical protein